MSHMDTYHVVHGQITSADTALLDQIQANLPDEGDVILATEYQQSRVENDDGSETLRARMNFARGETELPDGSTVTGAESASQLFQQVVSSDLASKADGWKVRHYESPDGGVTVSMLEEYFEANPDKRPTRAVEQDDGTTTEEAYTPTVWQPTDFTIEEDSG